MINSCFHVRVVDVRALNLPKYVGYESTGAIKVFEQLDSIVVGGGKVQSFEYLYR